MEERRECARVADFEQENDIQLTNVVDVCRSLLQVEGSFQFKPNEVYLITTSITPWFVWCLRIGSASFFDLAPEDRGWEISIPKSSCR